MSSLNHLLANQKVNSVQTGYVLSEFCFISFALMSAPQFPHHRCDNQTLKSLAEIGD